jgi:hypothetical protein
LCTDQVDSHSIVRALICVGPPGAAQRCP